MKKYSESIQRFGRSLLLPIGVMAPIGLLLGVSGAFSQAYMIKLIPFLGNPIVNGLFLEFEKLAILSSETYHYFLQWVLLMVCQRRIKVLLYSLLFLHI